MCRTPVRLSTQPAWKIPSASATKPAVSPGDVDGTLAPSSKRLSLSVTRTLGSQSPRRLARRENECSTSAASPTSRAKSYHMTPTTPALLTDTAGRKES